MEEKTVLIEYGLTRGGMGSPPFLPLTEVEYNDVLSAKKGLLYTVSSEEKFDLIINNYLEFETCLLDSTARMMLLRNQDYHSFQLDRNLFNRRLMNLLSACRSYVDYTPHHIGLVMPEEKEAVLKVNAKLKHYYDSCFGFRVMESLRNYTQHRGFPIHAIEYPGRRIGDENSRFKVGIALYTKCEYLGEDRQFKQSVLSELENRGGRVNLKPLVREYITALGGVHELARELAKAKLEAWEKTILLAIDRYKSNFPNEGPIVGLVAVIREKEMEIWKEHVEIFTDLVDYCNELQRKNRNLDALQNRYVTGEDE